MRWMSVVTGESQTSPVASASWVRYRAVRDARCVAGSRAYIARTGRGIGKSGRGSTQPGRRVVARPARVRRERERIEHRRNVNRGARIAGVSPRAADPVRALEDDEVVDAGRPQLDRRAEAAEAGPDYQRRVDMIANAR